MARRFRSPIDWTSCAPSAVRFLHVKGKIVVVSVPFDQNLADNGLADEAYSQAARPRFRAPAALARLGAVGALVRSAGGADYRLPHTGSSDSPAGVTPIPSAAPDCRRRSPDPAARGTRARDDEAHADAAHPARRRQPQRDRRPAARPGGLGTDIWPLQEAGVAAFEPIVDGRHYFDFHHTAADTLDKVEPDAMRRQVALLAVLAYILAESAQPVVATTDAKLQLADAASVRFRAMSSAITKPATARRRYDLPSRSRAARGNERTFAIDRFGRVASITVFASTGAAATSHDGLRRQEWADSG